MSVEGSDAGAASDATPTEQYGFRERVLRDIDTLMRPSRNHSSALRWPAARTGVIVDLGDLGYAGGAAVLPCEMSALLTGDARRTNGR